MTNNSDRQQIAAATDNQAETEEGRNVLHAIAVRKYHNDEYRAGML